MNAGGEGLQQWISQALAESGEMKRNERDFSGVEFDAVTYTPDNIEEVNREYDRAASVLSAMVAYSNAVRKVIQKKLSRTKANTNEDKFTASQAFSSVSHNYVKSLLLGLKLDAAAKRVAESVKAGEKPVIALTETKGAFLDDYASEHGLKTGERIDAKFSDILVNAVDRMHTAKQKDSTGEEDTIRFMPEE